MDTTNRGFGVLPAFPTEYYGEVRVQESSNAMGPHLWIFTEKNPSANGQESPSLQLTLNEARQLRTHLDAMIEHLANSWVVEEDE